MDTDYPDFHPTWIAQAMARKRSARQGRLTALAHEARELSKSFREDAHSTEEFRAAKKLDKAADRLDDALTALQEAD